MSKYPLYDTWTPGGRKVLVSVIDPAHEVFRTDDGVSYTIPCYDESGIRYIAECIKEAIRNKRNCPILVTGDPGLGKSTLILHIAQRVDPKFNVDQVAFELDEFEDIFKNNPYGDAAANLWPQVNMDEAGHAMYGPEYLELEQRVIAKNLIVSRIKKQIVYFASPKWKLIHPHVRNLMTIWIHVFEPDYYLQGSALVKFAPPKRQSEYQQSKYWQPNCVFTFPPLANTLWEEYEAKKVAFVDNAWASDKNEVSVLKRIAQNLRSEGMTQEKIAAIIGRDRSRVSRYLKSHD